MKASEVIKVLQELIAKHGDLPVKYTIDNDYGDMTVQEIIPYDKNGNSVGPFVEFYIH